MLTSQISSVRLELYLDADRVQVFNADTLEKIIDDYKSFIFDGQLQSNEIESFLIVRFNDDKESHSFSCYDNESLKMLLASYLNFYKLYIALNKKGYFKNGKKES